MIRVRRQGSAVILGRRQDRLLQPGHGAFVADQQLARMASLTGRMAGRRIGQGRMAAKVAGEGPVEIGDVGEPLRSSNLLRPQQSREIQQLGRARAVAGLVQGDGLKRQGRCVARMLGEKGRRFGHGVVRAAHLQ